MRPLPYHLATPLLFGKNWSGQPDLHRHFLIGSQKSCCWTMTARYEKKTNTAASPVMDSHPQDDFSADLSVFQAHLPCHEVISINSCRSLSLVYLSEYGNGRQQGAVSHRLNDMIGCDGFELSLDDAMFADLCRRHGFSPLRSD